VADTLARYGLAWRGYCLSVGTIEPRKQIDTLLDAFVSIDPALQQRYPLVLIGDRGWLSAATHERIANLQTRGRARYLGYVPQADLPMLYSAAAACLYASVYEGFGLPAVEAMASGAPLIATAAASLPEVCGDGAVLVAPGDSDAIAQALVRLLTCPDLAADLAARGRVAADRFSWQRTATKTVGVYRQLLQGA
jgi:alpha-1,3-rhamnosyl/mannosyltransferase